MSDGLKWARRLRLDLAFEIAQLETGVRKVSLITTQGPVDETAQTLNALKERFAHVENLIAAFAPPQTTTSELQSRPRVNGAGNPKDFCR